MLPSGRGLALGVKAGSVSNGGTTYHAAPAKSIATLDSTLKHLIPARQGNQGSLLKSCIKPK